MSAAADARVLVAGTGNIFLGDDGVGPAVVAALAAGPPVPGVRVHDYGVAGMHLALDLLGGYATLVLVDAIPRGGPPGTVHLVEVTPDHVGPPAAVRSAGRDPAPGRPTPLDAHGMDPVTVLASVSELGGVLPRTFVVGVEPAFVGQRLGLSASVEAAVPVAVGVVTDLLADVTRRAAGNRAG